MKGLCLLWNKNWFCHRLIHTCVTRCAWTGGYVYPWGHSFKNSRWDQEEGGELGSHEELNYHLRVQARSRGGRWCWTLKRAQKRPRAGRRSWAQKVGLPFTSLVPQQLCYGHCACDCLAQQLKQQLASHWQGSHYCLNIAVVLVVVHSLLSPCGLEQVDEPLTLALAGWSKWTSHSLFLPSPPFPFPNKPSHFCGCKATCLLTYSPPPPPIL